MINRVIYTWSIDRRLAPQRAWPGWRMLCFSDVRPPKPWEWVQIDRPANIERGNRLAKLIPPFFAEQSIYIDANVELLAIPDPVADIAMHMHRERDCLHDEIDACIKLGKADPGLLRAQAKAYAAHPRHAGLWECAMIYRRHTPDVLAFCSDWHDELLRWTHRDQIALPVVQRRHGMLIESLGNNLWSGGKWTKKHPKT